jgi:hypothetical protein
VTLFGHRSFSVLHQVDQTTSYDQTLHFRRSHLMTCDDDPSPCHLGGSTDASGKQQMALPDHLHDRLFSAIPQGHEDEDAGHGAKKVFWSLPPARTAQIGS